LETARNPMHVGSVIVFEGPPPAFDELVTMMESKLPLVPRYRQKVRFVPIRLARPVWLDDPDFNLAYHLRHTALPAPGGEPELLNLASRVLSQRLDRAKPLWEMWIVEGLEGGRWALVNKVHHAMVDGVAGMDLTSVILDPASDAPPPPTSGGARACATQPRRARAAPPRRTTRRARPRA